MNKLAIKDKNLNQIGTEKISTRTIKVIQMTRDYATHQDTSNESLEKESKMNLLSNSSIDDTIDFASLLIFPIS